MTKISGYPEDTNPSPNGFAIGDDPTPITKKTKWSNLIKMFFDNVPADAAGFGSLLQAYTPTVISHSGGIDPSGVTGGHYIDLCGIKLCWGVIGYQNNSVDTTGHMVFSLPTGFFSTIQVYMPTVEQEGNFAYQVVSGDGNGGGVTNEDLGFYISNDGVTAGGGVVSFLVIGI